MTSKISLSSFPDLLNNIVSESFEELSNLTATGVFFVSQSTQFPGTTQKYKNYYLLIRVENSFGGCCVEEGALTESIAKTLSGTPLIELFRHDILAVKVAAADAYLAHKNSLFPQSNVELLTLPASTPLVRAKVRDDAIARLSDIKPNENIALIGVINPLVEAIDGLGANCLPCDFNMDVTSTGLKVKRDMREVLKDADKVIATGMTLSNGSFDYIIKTCQERAIPLIIYAQTGASIFPKYLGKGVTALLAESYPYSQFTAEESKVYLYKE